MKLLNDDICQQEEIIDGFEEAWLRGSEPAIADFLKTYHGDRRAIIRELLHIDLEWRRQLGKRIDILEYCRDLPELVADSELMGELEAALQESSSREAEFVSANCSRCATDSAVEPVCQSESEFLPRQLGKFELLDEVGSGSFAAVYRARDTILDRLVAIKIPHGGRFATEQDRDRFAREARSVALLKHHGIVPIYDVVSLDGVTFIVSEFVAGNTLAQEVARRAFSPAESAEIVIQIADALDHAHRQRLIHRDLKPGNILLDASQETEPAALLSSANGGPRFETIKATRLSFDGQCRAIKLPYTVRLTDFGLARSVGGDSSLTVDGQLLGTPAYMSPEQAAGCAEAADPRSDVFSLGVMFYELLTGARPFVGTGHGLLRRIQFDDPAALRTLSPAVPRDLETICLKCLRKRPGERYESSGELADDLRRWQRYESIRARQPAVWERALRLARRNPSRTSVACAALLAFVLGLIGLEAHNRTLRHEVVRADRNADEAASSAAEARRQHYVANMNLASAAMAAGRGARAFELLQPFADFVSGDDERGWEWYYMWRRCHQELRVTKAIQGAAWSLSCDADGSRVAIGGANGSVAILETATGQLLQTWTASTSGVTALAFLPDGRLITGDAMGTLRIWNVATSEIALTFSGHSQVVSSIAVSPLGQFASSSPDGTTITWMPDSGQKLFVIRSDFEPNVQVMYDASGKRLFTLTSAGVIGIWDAASGSRIETLGARDNLIRCLAIHPDEDLLACGCRDGSVQLWHIATKAVIKEYQSHTEAIRHIGFRTDGDVLASTGDDFAVHTWNVVDERELASLGGRTSTITAMAYVPNSPLIVSCDFDGFLRVWADNSSFDLPEFKGDGKVLGVSIADDANSLVTVFEDGLCRQRELRRNGPPAAKYFCTGDGITTMDYCRTTRRVATGNNTGYVMIWDWDTTKQLCCVNSEHGHVTRVVFDPSGRRLASVGLTGMANIWDAHTGEHLTTLGDGNRPGTPYRPIHSWLSNAAFSHDGNLLGVVGNRGTLEVFDVNGKQSILQAQDHDGAISCITFSEHDRLLATGGEDKAVHLWNMDSRRLIHRLAAHNSVVYSLAFHPDGTRIISGAADGTVCVWRVSTGELMATFNCRGGAVRSLALNHDGSLLAVGTTDGSIYIWNTEEPRLEEIAAREALSIANYCRHVFGTSTKADSYLNNKAFFSEAVSKKARELLLDAPRWQEPIGTPAEGPWRFNTKSWMIAAWPDRTESEYQDALRWARLAYQASPDEPWVLTSLGAAYYRTRNFQATEQPLAQAAAQIAGEGRMFPVAFLAMCSSRLGHIERAERDLRVLREWMTIQGTIGSSLLTTLYREADLSVRGDDIVLPAPWNVTFHTWHEVNQHGQPTETDRVFESRPLASLQANEIDFDWGRASPAEGVPDDYFAVLATAEPDLPNGKFILQVPRSGWIRVYFDGRLVLDGWQGTTPVMESEIESSGGKHSLRVEYFATIARAELKVRLRP